MATKYVVPAGGNFATDATWSTTSGGSPDTTAPTSSDVARLDASSGNVTTTASSVCGDLDCTGYTGTLTFTSAIDIHGNVTAGSGMTLAGQAVMNLKGSGNHTITSNGRTWTNRVSVEGAGAGTHTLADAYTNSGNVTYLDVPAAGDFRDGGFAITFTGTNSQVSLNGGVMDLTGNQTYGPGLTVPWAYASGTLTHTGTITLTGATASGRFLTLGAKTYGTIIDSNTGSGTFTLQGAAILDTLTKTATVACTLALPTSSGITVTGLFNVNGVSGAVLTLTGDVTKAEGTVSCDYLAISSSDATGGAYFYAGANSTDGGSNTGWIFGAPTGNRPYRGGATVVTSPEGADTVRTIEGALVVL